MGNGKYGAVLLALAGFTIVVCSAVVSAETHVVGDSKGWALSVPYDSWSEGKTFAVGDTLVFNYQAGVHNVLAVSASEYQSCKVSSAADAAAMAVTGRHCCGCNCTATTSCSHSCSCSNGCQSQHTVTASGTTSTTKFELKKGVNYFICGIPGHCAAGMRLRVVAN